jgi:hypothetical protein
MESDIAQAIREWTEFGILIFATGFGIYRFIYKDIYVPERRTATLTVQCSLEEFGRTRDTVLIRARIQAGNSTEKTIYVPALWYNVFGIRFKEQAGDLEPYLLQIEQSPAQQNSRYSTIAESDVVAVGSILNDPTDYYHPADQTSNDILFSVPLNRYEALELNVRFFVTKNNRGLEKPEWEIGSEGYLEAVIKLNGEPYDPDRVREHGKWATKTGAGYNWAMSTLPLLPAINPPAAAPPAAPASNQLT